MDSLRADYDDGLQRGCSSAGRLGGASVVPPLGLGHESRAMLQETAVQAKLIAASLGNLPALHRTELSQSQPKSKPKYVLFCSWKINLSNLKITRTKTKDDSDSKWFSDRCLTNFLKAVRVSPQDSSITATRCPRAWVMMQDERARSPGQRGVKIFIGC